MTTRMSNKRSKGLLDHHSEAILRDFALKAADLSCLPSSP